jgi:hypothetical protein
LVRWEEEKSHEHERFEREIRKWNLQIKGRSVPDFAKNNWIEPTKLTIALQINDLITDKIRRQYHRTDFTLHRIRLSEATRRLMRTYGQSMPILETKPRIYAYAYDTQVRLGAGQNDDSYLEFSNETRDFHFVERCKEDIRSAELRLIREFNSWFVKWILYHHDALNDP